MKETARKAYEMIKETYRVHAGLGIVGSIFAVPLNQFTGLMSEMELIDPVNYN